jgi:hypothetical protein
MHEVGCVDMWCQRYHAATVQCCLCAVKHIQWLACFQVIVLHGSTSSL